MFDFDQSPSQLSATLSDSLVPSYSFLVIVENNPLGEYTRVSNIVAEMEYETYCEGGLNTYAHILPKPASTVNRLTLQRYLRSTFVTGGRLCVGARLHSPIFLCAKNPERSLAQVGVGIPGSGRNAASTDLSRGYSFVFSGCMVVKHSFGELDAEKSRLLEETLEVTYEKMYFCPGLTASINF